MGKTPMPSRAPSVRDAHTRLLLIRLTHCLKAWIWFMDAKDIISPAELKAHLLFRTYMKLLPETYRMIAKKLIDHEIVRNAWY